MTTPENFSYRDDQVVAKIAVDVPASVLTDLDQVRERTQMLRVEMEAIARASGTWNDYLSQIPVVAEQASQAYRNMITQMERMSYIQQELGGGSNIGVQGAPMGGGGGPAPYSTAAPSGYMDPFMGMPGQGSGMGMMGAQNYMQSMMMNDPRLFANMAAARGVPVNPVQLGLVGGAAAAQTGSAPDMGGGMGQGAAPPGSMSPQATQKGRDQAAPPDQTQSGQASTSEPQHIPEDPHPDSPAWQQQLASVSNTARSIVNETRGSGGIVGGIGAAMGALGRIGGNSVGTGGDDGGGGGGGGGGGIGGLFGGGGSQFGRIAKGAGMAGVGITAALGANKIIQDAGEQIQQYHNLGAQTGGGAMEGAGLEMQARVMAMNPFLTLEQSRAVFQSALKNGYKGEALETVTQFMASNLEEMNMTTTESMSIFRAEVEKGNVSIKDFADQMKGLKDSTGLSDDKLGQEARNQITGQTSQNLSALGFEGKTLTSATESITEAFSNNQQLKDVVPRGFNSNMNNPQLQALIWQTSGVKGVNSLTELPRRMQQQGINLEDAYFKALAHLAKQAQASSRDEEQAGSMFYDLATSMGLDVGTPDDAFELYQKLIGGENPGQVGRERKEFARTDPGPMGSRIGTAIKEPIKTAGNLLMAGAGLIGGNFKGMKESWDAAGRSQEKLDRALGPGIFDEEPRLKEVPSVDGGGGGTPGSPGSPGNPVSVNTEGQVSGEVRIVIDKDGNVTAPQSIQLTGNQRSVNSGRGSGTLNNPPPGDMHASPMFSGGR